MYCVYVLKNFKNKKLNIGISESFNDEFLANQNSVLVSLKTFKDKKEAGKLEKYLKSEKGLSELKAKIKRKALGILS